MQGLFSVPLPRSEWCDGGRPFPTQSSMGTPPKSHPSLGQHDSFRRRWAAERDAPTVTDNEPAGRGKYQNVNHQVIYIGLSLCVFDD